MGAQFKFNPCGCCGESISCHATHICPCIPTDLRLTFNNDYLDTGVLRRGKLYIPESNYTSVGVKYLYSSNAYPGYFGWSTNLAIPRYQGCGEIASMILETANNYDSAPTYSGFNSIHWSTDNTRYSTANKLTCDGVNFTAEFDRHGNVVGYYPPGYSGELDFSRQYDYFRPSYHIDGLSPPLGTGIVYIDYGTPYISYEQGCCPYLFQDEALDVLCYTDYTLSGTLTNYQNYFSGEVRGNNLVLKCESHGGDGGTFYTWRPVAVGWTASYNSADNYFSKLNSDLGFSTFYQTPSPCYPFGLRPNNAYWQPNLVRNNGADSLIIVRQDPTTPNGVPTLLTDARRIPRTLYGTFRRIGYSGDATNTAIQNIELNWVEGTRYWEPPQTTRCYDYPGFGVICGLQWEPTIERPTCYGTGSISFGPKLKIANLFLNDGLWMDLLNKNALIPNIGSGECKEYSLDLEFRTYPSGAIPAFGNTYTFLTSGWEIVSINPLLLKAQYQSREDSFYLCSGDFIEVEITE